MRKAVRNKMKTTVFKTCIICGKEIDYPKNKLCSNECKIKYRKIYWDKYKIIRNKRRSPKKIIKCAVCGKEVLTRRKIYCSRKCLEFINNKRRLIKRKKERNEKIFNCKNCNKEFRRTQYGQRQYCSKKCRMSFNCRKWREKKNLLKLQNEKIFNCKSRL
jgi:predicted nucleic acid-binding Zn ribbon protein